MSWLLRWQHVAPGTQVRGEHGTLEVIRQLQGFEIPASAWERFVLARRISDYDPANLDQLCLAGAVGWGRLSPHPATLEAAGSDENGRENRRRVIPTRVAPIAFFVREDADWLRPHHPGAEDSATSFLSPVAQEVLELLKQRGALFFPDMVRATGRLKAEIETGLWELVAAGLVTADGFENLRALVTPKSRLAAASERIGKVRRPRHAPGAGRFCIPKAPIATAASNPVAGCYCAATEWSFATCWCAKPICRAGANCRSATGGWKIAAKCAAADSSMDLWESSSRFRSRSNRCAPNASCRTNANSERVIIAAADPLNLVGIIVPGERIPAISGRSVTFRDGVWERKALLALGDRVDG